ncbi:MAG TPA: hypothetical protein VIU64_17555 [Polyangia bacterium]
MPTLLFTVNEVADALIAKARDLSKQITDLSDLKTKPLDPGESVEARYHKLAKLGKKLAAAFQGLDAVITAAAGGAEPDPAPAEPAGPDTPSGVN